MLLYLVMTLLQGIPCVPQNSIEPSEQLPVAGVVTAGPVPVLSPGREAEPAELVPALGAAHVHAALILLDRPLALGAGLGVGQDPVQVLRLCTVLHQPLLHCLAIDLYKICLHASHNIPAYWTYQAFL